MDLIYFNLIPSELTEIIISYISSLDLSNFNNLVNIKLNYDTIYYYHFGIYKRVNQKDYILDLGLSEFKDIFKSIYTLDELKDLKYFESASNQIKEIPRQIGNLINLKYLYLDHNQIREIPKEIGNLINLVLLNLSDNPIGYIPEYLDHMKDKIKIN